MMDANFQDNLSCPVCHEKANILEIDIFSPDNFYLEVARTAYRLPVDVFESQLKTFKCRECGSIFCNPWFSRKTSFEVFNLVYPQHNRGWEVLYDWLDGKEKQSYKALFYQVEQHIGTIASYGELNCPFQGNLLWMGEALLPKVASRRKSFRDLVAISRVNRLEYWMRKFRGLVFKINKIRLKEIAKHFNKAEYNHDLKIPQRRLLITTESTKFWGQGCFANGISCRALASAMLDIEVAPLWSLTANEKLDCIGVFNVLDHLDNPLETLFKLLEISRFVILVNHAQEQITKQHHFVLRFDFILFLESKNLKVIDITKEANFHSDEINKEKIILLISQN